MNRKKTIIGISTCFIIIALVLMIKPSFSAPEDRILTIKNIFNSQEENSDMTVDYLIELDDTSVNATFSNIEFKNGQATISLKPNEEISISFAADYKYKVTPLSELEGVTYEPRESQSGELSLNQESIITYQMVKEETSSEDEITAGQLPINETNPQSEEPINSATIVKKEDLEDGEHYIIFRVTGGKAYILTGKGNAKVATSYESFRGGKITWPKNSVDYKNILWEYQGPSNYATLKSMGEEITSYLTLGRNTNGQRPVGTNIAYVNLATSTTPAMKINNGNYYLDLFSDKKRFNVSSSGASVYLAKVDEDVIKVSFDASNGGESIYDGASEITKTLISGDTITIPTQENITMPKNYNHKLVSWVDIDTGEEVTPGETITPRKDTVYYANYQAENYNIGVNKDTVESVSTKEFMTTKLYDINDLFNLNSAVKTQSRDYNGNKEYWSLLPYGEQNILNKQSLGLSFFDTSKSTDKGNLSQLDGRDKLNANRQEDNGENYYDGIISQGIIEEVKQQVFNDSILGVTYIGTGDYLYQFDKNTGYYYYDSTKNAASYNQKDNRFYVYNYTYGTSKSEESDQADFLPFNYMSKTEAEKNKSLSASNGYTNYWFAMESDINFILPDNAGSKDSAGKYQNRGLNDNDMIFKFTGDDDIWVYIDNELVLDMGGVHDVIYGEINFSTGIVTIAQKGAKKAIDSLGYISFDKNETSNNIKVQQYDISHIKAGNHVLKIYYLERGASQSNMGIYFNVSDKYKDNAAIEVSKKVEGTTTQDEFNFHIKLNKNLTGQYGDIQLTNGNGTFSLQNGENIYITGLPSGIEYEIIEETNEKYKTNIIVNNTPIDSSTVTGKLIGGKLEKVNYTNTSLVDDTSNSDQSTEKVPNTYDNIIKYIVLLTVSGISLLAITTIIIKKRKKI